MYGILHSNALVLDLWSTALYRQEMSSSTVTFWFKQSTGLWFAFLQGSSKSIPPPSSHNSKWFMIFPISDYVVCKIAARKDECSMGTHNCDPNGICNNTYDSFTCNGCLIGFTGSGMMGNCYDINECLDSNLHNCDIDATCNNLIGSFNCSCNHGFNGSGIKGDCQRIPCFEEVSGTFTEIYDFNESSCLDIINESKIELGIIPSCIQENNVTFAINMDFNETLDCSLLHGAILTSYTKEIEMAANRCSWHKECQLINFDKSKVCQFNCYNDIPNIGYSSVSLLIMDDISNVIESAKLCEIDINL